MTVLSIHSFHSLSDVRVDGGWGGVGGGANAYCSKFFCIIFGPHWMPGRDSNRGPSDKQTCYPLSYATLLVPCPSPADFSYFSLFTWECVWRRWRKKLYSKKKQSWIPDVLFWFLKFSNVDSINKYQPTMFTNIYQAVTGYSQLAENCTILDLFS